MSTSRMWRAGTLPGVAHQGRIGCGTSPSTGESALTAGERRPDGSRWTDVQHWNNGLKTAALLAADRRADLFAGSLIGGRSGLIIALVIALGVNGYAYFNSDKLALRAMRAYPVTETAGPAALRDRAGAGDRGRPADAAALRQPDRRSPTPSPPGATRATPRSASPQGILELLDRRELRGVLGHELSHVYNRDILISSVAGAMATVDHVPGAHGVVRVALRRARRTTAAAATRSAACCSSSSARWRPGLIQLAISRSREYQADAPVPLSPATRWPWRARCARSSAGAQARPLPRTTGWSPRAT